MEHKGHKGYTKNTTGFQGIKKTSFNETLMGE